ncbi:TadE/TadG family type IV pilus assembly protein [Pseudomonas sp. SIMBA_077]
MKVKLPHQQKGAVAIEFALVFVVFFAVLYGVISYSLPLLLVQSFNHSTAEAVRRSVAVDPTSLSDAAYKKAVEDVATGVLNEKLSWVPSGIEGSIQKVAAYDPATKQLTVTVTLPADELSTLMPVLKLPGITVPSLPETLTAQSSLQF